jgi:acyl-CoA reductase-like NAD-dependent aldehyde dehydrogenase
VLSVIRFHDGAEAIALANDTQYGLAAYLQTNELRRAAPFGGMKQSGFGRMGGRYGLEDFMRPKNVYIPLV